MAILGEERCLYEQKVKIDYDWIGELGLIRDAYACHTISMHTCYKDTHREREREAYKHMQIFIFDEIVWVTQTTQTTVQHIQDNGETHTHTTRAASMNIHHQQMHDLPNKVQINKQNKNREQTHVDTKRQTNKQRQTVNDRWAEKDTLSDTIN
jgi:hypothetical protein